MAIGIVSYEKFYNIISDKNLKVADVCKATGIHPSMFSDWKSGKSKPKADKLFLIASYLGILVEELIEEKTV